MCGLTGFLESTPGPSAEELQATIRRMTDTITHRGPDDSGEWVDPAVGVALGFRRLSIVDLSVEGHQPMASASGRYMMVFNGEVYNHQAIRAELERSGNAPQYRGHSDTEVMLAAFTAWGVEAAVSRFVGMFAIALWDRVDRTLYLMRDRLGIKPLYYGRPDGTFLFGSELKALKAHPAFNASIDRDALSLLVRHDYIPGPSSIYQGIAKLPPGTILTVTAEGYSKPHAYWSAYQVAEQGLAHPFTGSDEEAVERLDALLRDSIQLRMLADVPLGAFLSGGIDSSTVVALMQALSHTPVRTFSIGFHEEEYNEAEHARSVAQHLGTDHTDLYVTAQEAMDVIPRLPAMYDEPLADSSQIPTYLVSELARRHVTVSLSGDGGDELFGGYQRYQVGGDMWRSLQRLPGPVRRAAGGALSLMPVGAIRKAGTLMEPLMGKYGLAGSLGDKLHRSRDLLSVGSGEALYESMMSYWRDAPGLVIGASRSRTPFNDPSLWPKLPDLTHHMFYTDLVTWLTDDILAKVDRASMAVSLEARVPVLDHRVVEFAWQVPAQMKIRNGQGKWLLRQVLYRYVPQNLVERPKRGFCVPIDTWLRGPLRDWAESLLDERRLRQEGYFQPEPIRQRWADHLSGERDWQYYLWSILMFQAWLEANG